MDELSGMCRVCAEIASPAISLLDPGYQLFNQEAKNLLNLEIAPSNGFPTNVCPSCLKIVNNWLSLKHTCALSQQYFASVLGVQLEPEESSNQCSKKRKMRPNTPEQIRDETQQLGKNTPENSVNMISSCDEDSNGLQILENTSNIKTKNPEKITNTAKLDEILIDNCNTDSDKIKISEICSENINAKTSSNADDIITEDCLENPVSTCSSLDHSSEKLSSVKSVSNNVETTPQYSNLTENVAYKVTTTYSHPEHSTLRMLLDKKKNTTDEVSNLNETENSSDKLIIQNIEESSENHPEVYLEEQKNIEVKFYNESTTTIGREQKICNICHKSYYYLQKHLLKHPEISGTVMKAMLELDDLSKRTCPHCKLVVPHARNFKAHVSSHDEPQFICDVCGNKYRIIGSLRRHIKEKHPNVDFDQIKREKYGNIPRKPRRYRCGECGLFFKSRIVLTLHVQKHYDKIYETHKYGSSKVEQDVVQNVTGDDWETMVQRAGKNGTSLVDQLGESSNTQTIQLSEEDEDESELVWKCLKCDAEICMDKIQEHLSTEHNTSEVEIKILNFDNFHQCKICDIIFETKDIYEKHCLTHVTEPIHCLHCNKSFKTSYHYDNHMKKHCHDTHNVQCTLCKRKFNTIHHLKNHMNEIHAHADFSL